MKKNKAKRLFVMVMTFVLVFSTFSAFGYADDTVTTVAAPTATKEEVKATTIKAKTQNVIENDKLAISLTWEKKGADVDYYQVFRSGKKTFSSSAKAIFTTSNGDRSYYTNTKGIKSGTKYYYKVRGVKVIDGKKYYTKWSNTAYRTAKYPVADSVWYDGVIYTADDDFSTASALAVVDDKLVYVGKDSVAKKLIGKKTKTYDLDGKCVLPGLIESHMHAENTGWMNVSLNVFWLPKETILEKVKKAAEEAKPG